MISSLEDSRFNQLSYAHKKNFKLQNLIRLFARAHFALGQRRGYYFFNRADGESRTHDLLFTRQLLQPIELHRRTAEARVELAISRFKAERVANYATPHQSGWRRS